MPGTWLTGAERVAIASETRNAPNCTLCKQRKDALSLNDRRGARLLGCFAGGSGRANPPDRDRSEPPDPKMA